MIETDIVWCNGTFDILHPGHIQLFKVARSLGRKVIVATDTDEKIKADKGDHRQSMIYVIEWQCLRQLSILM